jgi:hypothetical protein
MRAIRVTHASSVSLGLSSTPEFGTRDRRLTKRGYCLCSEHRNQAHCIDKLMSTSASCLINGVFLANVVLGWHADGVLHVRRSWPRVTGNLSHSTRGGKQNWPITPKPKRRSRCDFRTGSGTSKLSVEMLLKKFEIVSSIDRKAARSLAASLLLSEEPPAHQTYDNQ